MSLISLFKDSLSYAEFEIETVNCNSFKFINISELLTTTQEECSINYIDSPWILKWYYDDQEIAFEEILEVNNPPRLESIEVSLILSNKATCFDDTATKIINVPVNSNLFIPNAISANGDGVNSTLNLDLSSWQESSLIIADRKGKVVFKSINTDVDWQSAFNSRQLTSGIYTYFFKGTSNDCEESIEKIGTITVLN